MTLQKILLAAAIILFWAVADGQTNISGGIYSDTSWSQLNSPFIINDTVIIYGVELRIQPGVTVKFQDNGLLQTKLANGRIIAIGTVSDSITFTSNSSSPFPGIYSGVYLQSSFRKSIFNYCNFCYADKAIRNGFSQDSLAIRNSVFRSNRTGIYQSHGLAYLCIIDSCIFRRNTDYGLFDIYHAKISHCTIDSNQTGIKDLSSTMIENSDVNSNLIGINGLRGGIVNNCTFRNNQSGLEFNNINTYNYVFNSLFENNQYGIIDTIRGHNSIKNCYIQNNQFGITCKNDSSTTIDSSFILFNQFGILNAGNENQIRNCRIDSNTIVGIQFDSSAQNCSVINCDIKNNPVGLFDIGGLSPNLFTRNIFEYNSIGIILENSIDTFNCNRICNNNSFGLKYLNLNNFELPNNYWCTSDSISTAPIIFDGNDTMGVGNVQFLPLDTINCYLCEYDLVSINPDLSPSCSACQDGVATAIVNGLPPYSYIWNTSPVQTNQTATGLSYNIFYTVCVTDAAGCMGCGSFIFAPLGFSDELHPKINISFYPNPFSAQSTLLADNPLRSASLTVNNCFGQTVKKIENIEGYSVVISRENLPGGLYFVYLTQDNQIIATKKLIITD